MSDASSPSAPLVAVVTTVGSEAQADLIARAAVEHGLAACVQAEPIRSVYRWKGNTETSAEIRLTLKTTLAQYGALERLLLALHPYELPAVYVLPVLDASPAYGAWVRESVGSSADSFEA